eukprot:TRINITY_DN1142_c0_g1_i1.p1 TRINITY_DN1142_c0_g1~~TRINITY_DN1142_c0_g1_i1.p1  ORF type:complete len:183 (-),score=64.23 TRINITY_DN1142_c0_g1_i1:151-699(-)
MGNAPIHSRILVLGIDGAGKTTFLNKYENPSEDISTTPTQAYIVRDIKVKGVKFNVWDVSGKESTRALWKHYYKEGGTDAIIWVIDAASPDDKLEETKSCLHNAMLDPALDGVILFIAANKQDVSGARSAEQLKDRLNCKAFEGKRPWFMREISAKNGSGIKEAMEQLSKEVKTFYKNKPKQ